MEAMIQEKWAVGYCVAVTGIFFANGELVLMECEVCEGKKGVQIQVRPLARSSLTSALEFNEEIWTSVTELATSAVPEADIELGCGETDYGSDGYVRISRLSNKKLLWSAFFHGSNPFSDIRHEAGTIIAKSTYGHTWSFPLEHPEHVTVGRP